MKLAQPQISPTSKNPDKRDFLICVEKEADVRVATGKEERRSGFLIDKI